MYKRNSWLSYCKSLTACDTKMFWKKASRHFHSGVSPIDGFMTNKNHIITSPSEMCSIAKNYYEDQFTSHRCLGSHIETEANNVDIEIEEFMRKNSFTPINITYHDVRKSIASLKNKNSSGVDGVSNRILKILPPNHLSFIFNCFKNFAVTLKTPSH